MKTAKRIIILILATNILLMSCKKSEDIESNILDKNDIECYNNNDRGILLPALAIVAIAKVIINLSEGQYYKITTMDPSTGATITEEGCRGIGHCKIQVRSAVSGNSLTPEEFDNDYDCEGFAYIAKTANNHMLLYIDNNRDNEIISKRLFYSDSISISRPLIINDKEVLRSLNHQSSKEIIIHGKYKTYNDGDKKFIIIY